MIPRFLDAPKTDSFFLFGPRGTGKSTWLKQTYPNAFVIDLLESATYQELLRNPSLLEPMIDGAFSGINQQEKSAKKLCVIDEVQRLPALLNEVHRLIETKKYLFILTGSSARKLRREGANLLAGRALLKQMHPFTAAELTTHFDLHRSLQFGHLPGAYFSSDPEQYLKSYVGVYLREEVQFEAQVRNLAQFSKFLESASYSQASVLSVAVIAKDCGVDRKTAENYFQLLEDLLLGVRLPVFQRRAKRKLTTHPKFYYFDTGVFRVLRPRGPLDSEAELEGAGLETLVLQELRATIANYNLDLQLYFWRSHQKVEVDFVLYGKDGLFAIEVKRSSRIRDGDLHGLEEFLKDYPMAKACLLYAGTKPLRFGSIDVLPIEGALKNLSKMLGRDNR